MDKRGFYISTASCIAFATALLILPLRWLLAMLIASAVHELFHILAVYLCNGKVLDISFYGFGAKIRISSMSWGKELICALAGPVGGLLLLPLARYIPRIAVCAAFQSIYNLLPIYPLDGGRALLCIMQSLFPGKADEILQIVDKTLKILLIVIGLYACFYLKLGLLPLIFVGSVVFRKRPCKQRALRLQ